MDIKLFINAITKFILGLMIIIALLFIPAGSFNYSYGWLFILLLFVPMFLGGLFLMFKNPKLLRIRLNAKEKEKEQKDVIMLSGIMFIIGFVLAGLNYRFDWLILPNIVVIIFSIIFALSYLLYAEILRENTYLSRTIEVQKNQKIIDTGCYKIVRHPMYAITIILFLSIPFILNSLFTFFVFLIYPLLIIKRIKNEEKVLEKDLPGYLAYEKKVKYKLIPFIW